MPGRPAPGRLDIRRGRSMFQDAVVYDLRGSEHAGRASLVRVDVRIDRQLRAHARLRALPRPRTAHGARVERLAICARGRVHAAAAVRPVRCQRRADASGPHVGAVGVQRAPLCANPALRALRGLGIEVRTPVDRSRSTSCVGRGCPWCRNHGTTAQRDRFVWFRLQTGFAHGFRPLPSVLARRYRGIGRLRRAMPGQHREGERARLHQPRRPGSAAAGLMHARRPVLPRQGCRARHHDLRVRACGIATKL